MTKLRTELGRTKEDFTYQIAYMIERIPKIDTDYHYYARLMAICGASFAGHSEFARKKLENLWQEIENK